jgi:hypothetical protein
MHYRHDAAITYGEQLIPAIRKRIAELDRERLAA